MPSLFRAIARLLQDQRGVSAMIVAIALPALVGFGALGAETGLWFTIKLHNQSAADAAAISAAYEVVAGKTDVASDLTPAAGEAANRNGYKGSSPAVVYPYSDAMASNGIAVTLQQSQRAILATMFLTEVNVATKAVAVIEVLDHPCILALAGSGTGLEVLSGAHLSMPNCSAAANSIGAGAIELQDTTSSVTAATLVTAGEISLQGSLIDPAAAPPEFALGSPAMIGAPIIADPYAATLTHTLIVAGMASAPTCRPLSSRHIVGNCKASTWTVRSGHTVDLSPGTYWLTGNLTVQKGGTLECSTCNDALGQGVTIILTTTNTTGGAVGNVDISTGAAVTLRAPGSGTFSGILLIQDPLASSSASTNGLEGGPGMKLIGLLYFPKTTVAFQGNPAAACALLVANQVLIVGASDFSTSGCPGHGLAKLATVNTVVLAE
jgi:Flp pilus assembly protein TadG